MSTLKSAIELKQVFEKLQLAEQSGMPADELRKLEEQAAEQGLRTMWKVSLCLLILHVSPADILGCEVGS
jgi:hypothetical protein